jgi:signal-transduction protein with cAMP-binding, CBS, and nucleotidyltransferase domain
VRHDAFLYVAMGRMDRLKLRHLLAVDESGRPVGMVTVRGLLHLRSSFALSIGDEINAARNAVEMSEVRGKLPALAGDLLGEGVGALGVAAVTSSVLRDLTARAAQLAEEGMAQEAWGPAPAPWCVLLLGSGGRRESLFAADQDNAIVHAGKESDDPWYAEAGRRIADTLDAAGVPYCTGGVMAKNPQWRHNVEGWRAEIDRWVKSADGKELLDVDIFVDFRPVYGDVALADQVRDHLTEKASRSSHFLHGMAASVSTMRTAIGVLGQFKTKEGRIDIKLSGLLPLVSAARLLALKHRITATGTADRLSALADGEYMSASEAQTLKESHELMVRVLIEQQIADGEAGVKLSNRIDPKRLAPETRDRLKDAFKRINALGWVMQSATSTL